MEKLKIILRFAGRFNERPIDELWRFDYRYNKTFMKIKN